VFLAVAKSALDAGVFVISVTSGPSQYAGKLCNPHLFVTSFQNDEVTESIAIYMQQKKIPDTYFLGPNYQGGRDQLSGLKRYYKGKLSVIWTTLGQLDYSGEIARVRASNPTSIVFFYPGGMGINFLKQFEQSGLKGKIPLYVGASILDQTILPATGNSALGVKAAAFWSEQLDNAASKKFTSDFENTYHRIPSPYSATAYDAVRMMDAALATIGGKIEDKQGFQHAMENVKFDSVRGAFKFNTNHFPIQNAYLTEIVKDDQGRPINALRGVIVKNMTDSYVHECKMHR
jgi:branched-chain amino acid transport system substrate-binding protein